MELLFELPKVQREALKTVDKGEVIYCVPFDISGGMYINDGYVAVTKRFLTVIRGENIIKKFELCDCDDIRSEGLVNCGVLVLKEKGIETVVARFSMHHQVRFSYVAKGASLLKDGEETRVVADEAEPICHKCGHVIPGTGICPKCDGRSGNTHKILALCKPYWWKFLIISLIMGVASLVAVFQQQWNSMFIDEVLTPAHGTASQIAIFFAVIIGIAATLLGLEFLRRYLGIIIGSKISYDLRESLFKKIEDLSLSFVDQRKPGELMGRITGDTDTVRNFMQNIFTDLLANIITFVFAFGAMLIMDWKLALLAFLVTPVFILFNRFLMGRMHKLYRNQRKKDDTVNNHLQDVIQGIRVVKIFRREDREIKEFEKTIEDFAVVQRDSQLFWAYFRPFLEVLFELGALLVLFFAGYGLLNGNGNGFTIGRVAQFVAYSGMMRGPLAWFANIPQIIMNMRVSLARIDDVMENSPEIDDAEDAVEMDIKGNVEFKNVTFGYHSYEPILSNVSIKAESGEMTGLVGESGAGKSTIINLLMRLYDVDDGEILIDGVNIKNISKKSLHDAIGVVLQENFLFSGTIEDNIRFSKPDATAEEVIFAAKTAGAHDFICCFPDGYNTRVGEKGHRLSGGERQRIAIARAILGNPKLLIMDEATSALDTQSEFHIKRALERLYDGRTTFAIAHRLSTLKNSTRIAVIDRHKLAEEGSHEELVEQEGIYKNLVDAQLQMHKIKK